MGSINHNELMGKYTRSYNQNKLGLKKIEGSIYFLDTEPYDRPPQYTSAFIRDVYCIEIPAFIDILWATRCKMKVSSVNFWPLHQDITFPRCKRLKLVAMKTTDVLTHCSLVTWYGVMELDKQWFGLNLYGAKPLYVGLLSVGTLRTNFTEISTKIQNF